MPLTISLPDEWKEFLDSDTAAFGLQTREDYVQFLLTLAHLGKDRARVNALLEEGLKSEPSSEWTSQDWDDTDCSPEVTLPISEAPAHGQ